MTEPDGTALVRLLNAAVPELRGPEDRMSEVAGRLRRRRRNMTLAALSAAVGVTALLVSLPQVLVAATAPQRAGVATAGPSAEVGPPTLGEDDCPHGPPPPASGGDIAGALVPIGATSVILCELGPQLGQPRILTTKVAEMVNQLNLLPNPDQRLREIRLREEAAGRVPVPDIELGCHFVLYHTALSLVLRYPDRAPFVVWADRNCGTMVADGRTRYYSTFNPIDSFLVWYRDQLVDTTDPATVPTPTCPASLSARQIDPSHVDGQPQDGIARNRIERDPLLPVRLVAVAACRYEVTASGVQLVTSQVDRDPVITQSLADAANKATVVRLGSDGGLANGTDCGSPGAAVGHLTVLDVILVADATGAVSEIRVWRKPCEAVITRGKGGLTLTPELRAILDGSLVP